MAAWSSMSGSKVIRKGASAVYSARGSPAFETPMMPRRAASAAITSLPSPTEVRATTANGASASSIAATSPRNPLGSLFNAP
jgi:hypothetical protein